MKNWREILEGVQEAKTPCFLLPKILEQIPEGHHLAEFEFWLNHQSGLTDEENALVRAKIVGKKVPRHTYQAFFPIGMGKQFPGSHLVAAHLSPDLDTTVASFFGWLDAFAARVAQKQHYWAIAGAPNWQLFSETIHPQLFAKLARTNPSLTLSAQDLINQQAMHQVTSGTHVSTLDHRGDSVAIVLVDEEGHFIGDWQSCDVEPVRQVTILFKACLHWLQHHIHQTLTTLLAQETVSPFVEELLATPVLPIDEFDDTQKEKFLLFLSDILNMTSPLTLQNLLHAIERAIPGTFQPLLDRLEQWPLANMIDNRPQLFQWLQQTFHILDRACQHSRDWIEQLNIAIAIKHNVLQIPQGTLLLETEVSTIRQKMGDKPFLTVLSGDTPVGVIFLKDIQNNTLGTVSLRDFCNEEEMNLASYLQVISVVDHHKSQLITKTPPLALISDTQSTNVLI
ncbi:MAG: hypothetical protein KDK65_02945, partial [Chlamydiia bacterium]|nr:hypothetical protein [Chlamydiia bacterium]